MPWSETDEHNQRLLEALQQLANERGALERLVGAINSDDVSKALDEARRGDKHQPRKAILATTTLTRWLDRGFEGIKAAQPHKKRIVFEFLERSKEFQTAAYSPASLVPEGLVQFFCDPEDGSPIFRFDGLSLFDGDYYVFERHLDGPDNPPYMVVSTLSVETIQGITCLTWDRTQDAENTLPPSGGEHAKGVFMEVNGCITMLAVQADGVSIFSVSEHGTIRQGRNNRFQIIGSIRSVTDYDEFDARPFYAVNAGITFERYDLAARVLIPQEMHELLGYREP